MKGDRVMPHDGPQLCSCYSTQCRRPGCMPRGEGQPPLRVVVAVHRQPTCFMLLAHFIRAAVSRTF